MSTLEYLGIGLLTTLEPLNAIMILLGLTIGVLAGALPGITMLNAIVLVLPFTYLMDIVPSLLLMIGIYCGGIFGGSITGILFNIPGDPMNIPTTWEGYKLNKKGFVSKALGMAIMTSALGGFFSALIMTFASPLCQDRPFLLFLRIFLRCFSGTGERCRHRNPVDRERPDLSFYRGLPGHHRDGRHLRRPRFTFGSRIMETGINFVTVLIGLFAIGEVLEQLTLKDKETGDVIRIRPKTQLPRFGELGRCGVPFCAAWESASSSGSSPELARPSLPSSATGWRNRCPNTRRSSAPVYGKVL